MSGHSKWKTIKHKKAAQDAKRGKAFTKLIKEITVVARDGGGDINANPRLRMLLEKAKEINMPQENITRAIKKGTGELPGQALEAINYEGYGPEGIAIVVEALTDNKNRTVSDMRHLFAKGGGNLAESGAVSWMFERKGVITIKTATKTEDDLLELLLDYDVSDIKKDEHLFMIYCDPKETDAVKQLLEQQSIKVEQADLEWVAKNSIELEEQATTKAIEFLEQLDDHDDVQHVYTNLA